MQIRGSSSFFTILLVAFMVLSFLVARSYLVTIILAIITASIFRPFYESMLGRMKGKQALALLVTILVIVFIVLLPLSIAGSIIVGQLITFAGDLQRFTASDTDSFAILLERINEFLRNVPGNYQIDQQEVTTRLQELIQPVGAFLAQNLVSIGLSTFDGFAKLIVFITTLSAGIVNFPKLIKFIRDVSPFPEDVDDLYINRVLTLARYMIKGIFIVSILNGIVVGVVLTIAGVPYALFWGLLAVIASIVPIGAGIVAIPLGLIELVTGNVGGGIFILLAFILVINNIDNILRPRLVGKDAHLHPALTLVGILGGLELFGFFGILVGPIVLIMLVTSLEVYIKYYSNDDSVVS